MKKEIVEGSYFVRLIEKITAYNILEGSLFFHCFFSMTSPLCTTIRKIQHKNILLFLFLLTTLITLIALHLIN